MNHVQCLEHVSSRSASFRSRVINNNNNNNNNNNKIFITVSMYLAHRANWGHLLLQNTPTKRIWDALPQP